MHIKGRGNFYEFVSFGKSDSFVWFVVNNLMENYKTWNLTCYCKALLSFVSSISDIKMANNKD